MPLRGTLTETCSGEFGFFALVPFVFTFHLFLPGWQSGLSNRWVLAVLSWSGAAFLAVMYRSLTGKTGMTHFKIGRDSIALRGFLFGFVLFVLLAALVFLWRG